MRRELPHDMPHHLHATSKPEKRFDRHASNQRNASPDGDRGGVDDPEQLDHEAQASLLEDVRAVLEAALEPSPTMTEAGAEIVRNVDVEGSEAAFTSDAADT